MSAPAVTGRSWTPASAGPRARDGVIDTMRGIAILMVIGIHSLPKEGGAILTAADALLRPCVPVFLFASGYLTAGTDRVPLGRRVRRTLEPYTVAFVAAYIFMAVSNPAMDHRLLVAVARYGLAYVFVYYYVFVYVGCTVLLWAVVAAAGGGAQRESRLILLLVMAIPAGLVCGAYLDPLLQRLSASGALIEEARMRDLPFWFAFMAVGMLTGLLRVQGMLRSLRRPLLVAAAAAYAVYAVVRIAGLGDAADYDSIAFFLYATLACLALLGCGFDNAALASLGSASFFIYLWHIFVIVALRQAPSLAGHPLLSFVACYAAALVLPVAVVIAARRLAPPRLAQGLGV